MLQITEEAGDCVLMQPLLAGLPPALRALCMVPAEPAYASPAKSRGHKSKAAEQEEAAEDHYEAAAPDQLFHDAGDAPGDMRDLPMGALTKRGHRSAQQHLFYCTFESMPTRTARVHGMRLGVKCQVLFR